MSNGAKMNDAAEYYLSAVKKETVKDFGKYLIEHATKLPDGTVGISAMGLVDLTVIFLEEMI